ncbi:hypothetical protein GCM10027290_15590 [Micromonospora sonneratiae]
MRSLAEVWAGLGEDLAPLEEQFRSVVAGLENAGQGPALAAAREFVLRISGGADSVLPKLREAIREVSEGARKVALEIEYAKLMIIFMAAWLLATLMKLVWVAVLTGGAVSPVTAAAPLFTISREVVKRLLKRLALAVVHGAAFMVGLDVAVQLWQVVVLGTREIKEWDLKKTGFMAGLGGLGGAIGWSLGWMRYLPYARGGTTWRSHLAPWLVTMTKNALAEGLPELIADEIVKRGGEDIGERDGFFGGLASGAVEGAIDHPTKAMNRGRTYFTNSYLLTLIGKLTGLEYVLVPPDLLTELGAAPLKDPSDGSAQGDFKGATDGADSLVDTDSEAALVADRDPVPTYVENVAEDPVAWSRAGIGEQPAYAERLVDDHAAVVDRFGGDGRWGEWDQAGLLANGDAGAQARQDFVDTLRAEEIAGLERLLDGVSGNDVEGSGVETMEGVSAGELRAEWLAQAEKHFDDVFGPLAVGLDPVSGVVITPSAADELTGMREQWRGFVNDVRRVVETGGLPSLTGLLFTHVVAGREVEAVADAWLAARPGVVVSAVDRIRLRDAIVAETRREFVRLMPIEGPVSLGQIRASVRAVGRGSRVRELIETRLAVLAAAANDPSSTATATGADPVTEESVPVPTGVVTVAAENAPLETADLAAVAVPASRATTDPVQEVARSLATPGRQPAPPSPSARPAQVSSPVASAPYPGMDSVEIPAGLYVPGPDDGPQMAENARALPVYTAATGEQWLTVVAHGDPVTGGVWVGGRVLDAADFGSWLETTPQGRHGRPILLVVCGAAATPGRHRADSFAARVRDLSGVPVVAATDDAWSSPTGAAYTGSFGADAFGRPVLDFTGSHTWQYFPATPGTDPESLHADLATSMRQIGAKGTTPTGQQVASSTNPFQRPGATDWTRWGRGEETGSASARERSLADSSEWLATPSKQQVTDPDLLPGMGATQSRPARGSISGNPVLAAIAQMVGVRVREIPGGAWIYTRRTAGNMKPAIMTALSAMPDANRSSLFVGVPGVAVSNQVLAQLEAMTQDLDPVDAIRTRLVVVGELSSDQIEMLRQRAESVGVEVVLTPGEVRPDRRGWLVSTQPWRLLRRDDEGRVEPGHPVPGLARGMLYPSPNWEQALGPVPLPAGSRRIAAGLVLDPSGGGSGQHSVEIDALSPDPDRMTVVATGWTDVDQLVETLDQLVWHAPVTMPRSLRVLLSPAVAARAQDLADRLGIELVVPREGSYPGGPDPEWARFQPSETVRVPVTEVTERLANLVRQRMVNSVPDGYHLSSDETMLGFDYFGFWVPRATPDFLGEFDFATVPTDQLPALFDRLDLTRRSRPSRDDLRDLPGRSDRVTASERTEDQRDWGWTDAQPPPLPARLEVPHLIHSIWLGGPLRNTGSMAGFRRNLELAAARTRDWADQILWTDVTRAQIDTARATPPPVDGSPDPWADIREFVEWADGVGVRLINVDEVFHVQAPMRLQAQYLVEHTKQVPTGFAAASDILRLAIVDRFGGLYSDGDNEIVGVNPALPRLFDTEKRGDLRPLLRELVEPSAGDPEKGRGFAFHRIRWGIGNSVVLAARGHPVLDLLQTSMERRYRLSQEELYRSYQDAIGVDADVTRVPAGWWQNRGKAIAARRHSVMIRTGPDILGDLSTELGLDRPHLLPNAHGVRMGSASSWLGSAKRRPETSRLEPTDPRVVESVSKVVATLVRGLRNRDGDLHLTLVAPVVARLPRPDAVWNTVLRVIAETPELAAQVRTVTASRLTPYGLEVVPLPAQARALLGFDDRMQPIDPRRARQARWWIDECLVPVTLPDRTDPATASERTLEVDTERWMPLRAAFTFGFDGDDRPMVARGPRSGVRSIVRYALTVRPQEWTFRVRLHLAPRPGVDPVAVARVEQRVTEAVARYLNQPRYVLPGLDARLRVEVEFVASPDSAHATVNVASGEPTTHDEMNQLQWYTEATEAAYAHEILHFIGVVDSYRRTDQLLRSAVPSDPDDIMDHHDGHDEQLVLTARVLAQVVDVSRPYVSPGSLVAGPRLAEPVVRSQVTDSTTADIDVDVLPAMAPTSPIDQDDALSEEDRGVLRQFLTSQRQQPGSAGTGHGVAAVQSASSTLVERLREVMAKLPMMADPDEFSALLVEPVSGLSDRDSITKRANDPIRGPVLTGDKADPAGRIEVWVSNSLIRSLTGFDESQEGGSSGLSDLANVPWGLVVRGQGQQATYYLVDYSVSDGLHQIDDAKLVANWGFGENANVSYLSAAWNQNPSPDFYPVITYVPADRLEGNELYYAGLLAATLRVERDRWRSKRLVLVADSFQGSGNPLAQQLADLLQTELWAATGAVMVMNGEIVSGRLATFKVQNGNGIASIELGLSTGPFGVGNGTTASRGWDIFRPTGDAGQYATFGPVLGSRSSAPSGGDPALSRPGHLLQSLPTLGVPALQPGLPAPPGMSLAAQRLFEQSTPIPEGRVFLDLRAGESSDLHVAMSVFRTPGTAQKYFVYIHGDAQGLMLGDETVDPGVLAEAIVNDPYRGRDTEVLLNICNVYAQPENGEPFLAVAQLVADGMAQRLGEEVTVLAAGGIVIFESYVGSLHVGVRPTPGNDGGVMLRLDHPAARFYRVFGRPVDGVLRTPEPQAERYPESSPRLRGEEDENLIPPSARHSEGVFLVPAELGFPVPAGQRLAPADLIAARLVGLGGEYERDVRAARLSAPDGLGLTDDRLIRALWQYLLRYDEIGSLTSIADPENHQAVFTASLWRGLARTAVTAVDRLSDRGLQPASPARWGYLVLNTGPASSEARRQQVRSFLAAPKPGPVRVELVEPTTGPDDVLIKIDRTLVADVSALVQGSGSQRIGLANIYGRSLFVRELVERDSGLAPVVEVVTDAVGMAATSGHLLWLSSGGRQYLDAERTAAEQAFQVLNTLTVVSRFDGAGERIQVGDLFLDAAGFADHLRRNYGWGLPTGDMNIVLAFYTTDGTPASVERFSGQLRDELGTGVLPTQLVVAAKDPQPAMPADETAQVAEVLAAASTSGHVLWLDSGGPEVVAAEQVAAAMAPRVAGMLTVVSHFQPLGQRLRVAGREPMTAEEFADHLRSQYGWPPLGGPDVLLMVCDAGDPGGDAATGSFAQRLSVLLGVQVLAPRGPVYTWDTGEVMATGIFLERDANGRGRLRLGRSGWLWHRPDGSAPLPVAAASLATALQRLERAGDSTWPPVPAGPLVPVRWGNRLLAQPRISTDSIVAAESVSHSVGEFRAAFGATPSLRTS